jgi:hypothetical protein
MIGMMMSPTSESTILVNAAPTTTAQVEDVAFHGEIAEFF